MKIYFCFQIAISQSLYI